MGAKLLSRRFTANMEGLALRDRMILVTCSGTIGNSVYVNATFGESVGSPDLLRIEANTARILPGYLYAFLNSPTGKALIKQKTYGAVVPHIEAHHVVDLPIPRLEPTIEERIHALVERAAALRVEAQVSRRRALTLASDLLKTDLSTFHTHNLLSIRVSRLKWRLDGAYYSASEAAAEVFRFSHVSLEPIGNLVLEMFYLGKLHRVFVDKVEFGVPLLSIADAQKVKLSSDKYVSRTQSRNVNQAILQQGWVLVSRGGTPGLAIYVRREMAGMAGTDDLVRLVCNPNRVLPGYLYAVLSSRAGYRLLVGSAHGSVQLHLPPDYISRIEIPVLPIGQQRPVHDLIEAYGEALTQASIAEDEAQVLLTEALGVG